MLVRLVSLLLLALSVATAGLLPVSPACTDHDRLLPVDRTHALDARSVPRTLVPLAAFDVPVLGNRNLQLDYGAALAYTQMIKVARADGVQIIAVSGYRSFDEQRYTFYRWTQWETEQAAAAGETIDEQTAIARANRYSALPGHSEHQLGTALDVSTPEIADELIADLVQTAAGRWLLAHAHQYGWVISYPPGKEALTGFNAEPWHIRYVGVQVASELAGLRYLDMQSNVTVGGYLAGRPLPVCSAATPKPRPAVTQTPRTWPDRFGD
ncbi:MAG: M15 family metallopeptidase [Chloroflexi bacterium]|nr:M15 family metallopeptidase [Chloroflexota bacterium]